MSGTPARYRKRPVEVTAVRWTSDNYDTITEFVTDAVRREGDTLKLWIVKSDTWGTVRKGDWVIAERDGVGFYPCTTEEFDAIYEPAE